MAAFNEMRTPTSRRWYGKVFRRTIAFLIALLCFCFRKIALKILKFFVATVSEMCSLTFRKYVTEQGIVMQNL